MHVHPYRLWRAARSVVQACAAVVARVAPYQAEGPGSSFGPAGAGPAAHVEEAIGEGDLFGHGGSVVSAQVGGLSVAAGQAFAWLGFAFYGGAAAAAALGGGRVAFSHVGFQK